MAAPNYHLEHSQTGSSDYLRFGTQGKFYEAEVVAADGTGSSGGAFMLGAGADDAKTEIHVAGGGMIAGPDLIEKTIYQVGVSKVHATGGKVYIFRRQQ